jgi:predicted component of type VI protein secretion system
MSHFMKCLFHENSAVMITHGNIICTFYQSITLGQVIEPFSVHTFNLSQTRLTTATPDTINHNSRQDRRLAHVSLIRLARLHLADDVSSGYHCHPAQMEHNDIPKDDR